LPLAVLWKAPQERLEHGDELRGDLSVGLALLLAARESARRHHHPDLGVAVERHALARAEYFLARASPRRRNGRWCAWWPIGSRGPLPPAFLALVRQLRRKRPKGGQRSLREIAAELERAGHFNERGLRYSAASVQHMLARGVDDGSLPSSWTSARLRHRAEAYGTRSSSSVSWSGLRSVDGC
jgi:hypothetical protein